MRDAPGQLILLTGATGYVGGRLLHVLESQNRPVRCLARDPQTLRSRVAPGTKIVAGDVLDADSLTRAMQGVSMCYYLVHSMAGRGDFGEQDPLDFWRVEAFDADRLLRLRAEMRVPGRAWLQFEVEPDRGGSTIRQTALFDPAGLGGLAYWYSLWPVHSLVFAGMLERIARAARASEGNQGKQHQRGGVQDTRPPKDRAVLN